ncbi:MAG: hypothetical protein M3N24_08885 [Actinomycetota bacterium]|nr:hypothetical protein [Actinomycetota bacterium]
MRVRTLVLVAAAGLAFVAAIAMPYGAVGREDARRAASIDPPATIHLFYSPLGLVRPGTDAGISVDAICTTAGGNPCAAHVTLGTKVGSESWETMTRTASTGLEFDVTEIASRAARFGSGVVRFFLRAHTATGLATSAGSPASPLKFWVLPVMPEVHMPSIPFGRVRKPATVLVLPWGSGPTKAGLAPGKESLTGGPSSFDVDEEGRIHLLDTEQDRLAVFSEGELVREVPVELDSDADVSVAADGTAYVLDAASDVATVRPVSPLGHLKPAQPLGAALSAHIRTVGNDAFANLLPADVWVPVPGGSDALPALPHEPFVGAPISEDAQLVRIGTTEGVRLGEVSGEDVVRAVEIRSETPLGEVALAEPDGTGGYWCVVRVWREEPSPADQYQVVHISGERIVESFAVSAEQFADTPPLSRFRLGSDGDLYQLTTSPSGVRIGRFDLGGEA